jgi:desulfoferrodoxin-like iron-binding protein
MGFGILTPIAGRRNHDKSDIFMRSIDRSRAEGGTKVAKVGEVYLCEICGNKVKVLEGGAGTLVCCGEDMVLVG